MKVLHVAAEVSPFAKVGGLADVVPALARALSGLGVEEAILMPLYRTVRGRAELQDAGSLSLPLGRRPLGCGLVEGRLPGTDIPVYFLDHPPFFDRPGIYGEGGGEYPDSLERFALLSRAGVALGRELRPDLVHVHDWHTALIPVYLRYDGDGMRARTVLTIHNLAYQGVYPLERAGVLDLTREALEAMTHRGALNILCGGIRCADAITTVSPSYAREILVEGEGLEEVLREREGDLVGILNGVDYSVWDPRNDPHIWANYSPDDLSGKGVNKRRLQEELGLEVAPEVPLVGMVARLVEQKGVDLIMGAFDRMMSLGIQFVVLGTGEPRYEGFLREAAAEYRGRVAALITFSEEWAHRIEAACDIFLMPSKFEPCGLNQMYSLRYGTVPVVRATGGLRDTVRDFDPEEGTGNGFTFAEYTPEAMLAALRRAVELYRRDPGAWRELMLQGMREDHSWESSAREYLRLYERIVRR